MKLLALSTDEGRVRLHAERIIGNARLALAAGGLVAVFLDPAEPAHFAPAAYAALVVYLTASGAILLALRQRADLPPQAPALLHAFDLAFAGLLTSFTEGAGSPFFVFVWFAMIAAAFRSGLRGTFLTAAVVLVVLLVQALAFPAIYRDVSPQLIVVRATYLGVMAFLLGYLAQKEGHLRTEAITVARVLSRSRQERTFSAGLEAAIDEIARLFGAAKAVLAITDADGNRHCWFFRRPRPAEPLVAHLTAVGEAEAAAYFFDIPQEIHAWYGSARPANRSPADVVVVDHEGNRARTTLEPPPQFWNAIESKRAVGAVRSFGAWHVRLYLPAPSARLSPPLMVHLLHTISQQVGPALVNMYLLRVQAGTSERARLARELHDRVVQSLIGLEMQLAALQQQSPPEGGLRHRLCKLQTTLRGEINNVRDLMHELRPVRVTGDDLPLALADMVERFQRQTGIRATFSSQVAAVEATPRQCSALVRIVQEALVNIRKHSGASSVVVALGPHGGGLRLTIEDDGRGFPFSGRKDHDQLWAEHTGPLVIKERARSIGARVAVESSAEGARLEVALPDAR